MPKAGTTLTDLFKRTGTTLDQTILDALEKLDLELPDELASVLQSKLYTQEDAQKNADIKKHFNGATHATFKEKLMELLNDEEFGFDDNEKSEIGKVTNTFEMPKAIATAIKRKEGQKVVSTSGREKQQLQAEIDQLKAKFTETQTGYEAKLAEKDAETKNVIRQFLKRQAIAGKPLTDALDKDILVDTIITGVDRLLREQGAELEMNEYNDFKLVQAADKALPFRMNNKDVSYDELVTQYIADKKLIKVQETPTGAPNPTLHQTTPTDPSKQFVGQRAPDFYQKQIESFQN